MDSVTSHLLHFHLYKRHNRVGILNLIKSYSTFVVKVTKKGFSNSVKQCSGVLISSCTSCALTIYQLETLCQFLSSPQHHWSSGNWSPQIWSSIWPPFGHSPLTTIGHPHDHTWPSSPSPNLRLVSTFSESSSSSSSSSSIVGMGAANSTGSGAGCIDRPTFRGSFKGHWTNEYLSALKRSASFSSEFELVFSGAIIHEWVWLGGVGWICAGRQKHEHGEWACTTLPAREGTMRTENMYFHTPKSRSFRSDSFVHCFFYIWWILVQNSSNLNVSDLAWQNVFAGRRKEDQGGEMGCVQGKSVLTEEDIDFIARNTAMKREAVEIQYKTFLQKHPDGRISRKSFHMMMKECYPGEDDDDGGGKLFDLRGGHRKAGAPYIQNVRLQ